MLPCLAVANQHHAKRPDTLAKYVLGQKQRQYSPKYRNIAELELRLFETHYFETAFF